MLKPKIGDLVQDSITKFKGAVTGITEYITGCRQFLVQPPLKKGDFVEARWIDEDRLKVLKSNHLTLAVERNGFDKPAPRK